MQPTPALSTLSVAISANIKTAHMVDWELDWAGPIPPPVTWYHVTAQNGPFHSILLYLLHYLRQFEGDS